MTAAATESTPPRRRRRAWRWLGISLLGILALAFALLYWLLNTAGGRDALLHQIITRLPAEATLTWDKVEGPLAGPLTLHGVDFRWDDIHFSAERLYLDPDLRPFSLLGRRLRLDKLELDNATLNLPPSSDEPFELPRWPDVLPDIAMPLTIQSDYVVINGLHVSRTGESLINIQHAQGGLELGPGHVHAEQLVIHSDRGRFGLQGNYSPRRNYRTDLVATAVFPAIDGQAPARLGLVARGDQNRMVMALSGNAPEPVQATFTLSGSSNPDWFLVAKAESFDPARLGLTETSTPLAFELNAHGQRGPINLEGRIEHAGQTYIIEPSRLDISGQVLTAEPLAIRAFEGLTTLNGKADFSESGNPVFDFDVQSRGVRWGEDAATAIGADADLVLAGELKAWTSSGQARLTRANDTATLTFEMAGDAERATLSQLQARMPSGTLDASGELAWVPGLQWDLNAQLAGFDPGYFAPGWDGQVSGEFSSQGQARPEGGYSATLDVPVLRGQLRDRPLDAQGKFALEGEQGSGDLQLRIGQSQVAARGSVGENLDINASFEPLRLDDLLPGAEGTITGHLRLSGPRTMPNLDAVDLSGTALAWNEWSAQTLNVNGRLPWRGQNGQVAIHGNDLQVGIALDSLRLDARGSIENLGIDGTASGPLGSATLSGSVGLRGDNWRGQVDTLQLALEVGSTWTLQQPARFAQQGAAWTLSQTCLSSSVGGQLCASADWPRQGVMFEGNQLPLALAEPWLPADSAGREMKVRGAIDLQGRIRPQGDRWQGNMRVTSSEGGLRLGVSGRRELMTYGGFGLDLEFDPRRIEATLGADLNGSGRIDAQVATGWEDTSPLSGSLRVNTDRVFWLELFSPDLVRPQGSLNVDLSLSGTRNQPLLGGQASLTNFTSEMPAMGITLKDGQFRLVAQPDGTARINGSVSSGGGVVTVDGTLGWRDTDTLLALNIRGENFLISDTRELRAVINPDMRVDYNRATGVVGVNGQVTVPSAQLDLERLDQGVSASPDVVVLDPVDPGRGGIIPLDIDLAVILKDDIRMNGFGLEGTLDGELRVRGRPGREMTGDGVLNVTGEYTAYGQDLTITRGRLQWGNSPISDPRIDVRAERRIGDVTAGVDVAGRASQPTARVWSNPEMPQSEAMAYLVLGRSLASATSRENQQINAASAALSAGVGLLGSQIGARLGLDDAGIMQSRALGGSVFGVGKFLSPRVYVGYGVSMIGEGQVLMLKFLLQRGFDVEIESSTEETRTSINWRRER